MLADQLPEAVDEDVLAEFGHPQELHPVHEEEAGLGAFAPYRERPLLERGERVDVDHARGFGEAAQCDPGILAGGRGRLGCGGVRRGGQLVQGGGQGGDRAVLEDHLRRELERALPRLGDDVDGVDRVAAELEEVGVHSYVVHAEHLRPQLGEGVLGRGRGLGGGAVHVPLVDHRRQRGAVEFAVDPDREGAQRHERGRDHVVRHPVLEIAAQLAHQLGPGTVERRVVRQALRVARHRPLPRETVGTGPADQYRVAAVGLVRHPLDGDRAAGGLTELPPLLRVHSGVGVELRVANQLADDLLAVPVPQLFPLEVDGGQPGVGHTEHRECVEVLLVEPPAHLVEASAVRPVEGDQVRAPVRRRLSDVEDGVVAVAGQFVVVPASPQLHIDVTDGRPLVAQRREELRMHQQFLLLAGLPGDPAAQPPDGSFAVARLSSTSVWKVSSRARFRRSPTKTAPSPVRQSSACPSTVRR